MADPISSALGVGGIASNIIGNALNASASDRSYAFAKQQYQDMKLYNSAERQVKRLRAAGMNPALTFGQNAGMAQAVSQPEPLPYQPLDLGGLSSLAEGINLNSAQVKNLESQTKKNEEEAHGYNIDNLFKHEDWISKLYNRDTESWLKNQLAESAKLAVQFDKQSLQDRLWQQKMESQLMQARAYAQFYVNEYIPQQQQAEIDNLVASAAVAYMQGRASLKQAHAAIMNAESTKNAFDAQYGGNPEQRSQFFKSTLDYLVQQKNQSKSLEWHNINSVNPLPYNLNKQEDYFNWRDKDVRRHAGF